MDAAIWASLKVHFQHENMQIFVCVQLQTNQHCMIDIILKSVCIFPLDDETMFNKSNILDIRDN